MANVSCVGLTIVLGLGIAACGSAGSTAAGGAGSSLSTATATAPVAAALARTAHVTLILDFVPNAVHAGIYRALAAGYYRRENIDLRVVEPTSTEETLKLIDAGKAQFGLADGSDVAGLIDDGGDARAVMALVQRPLGGLIALASEHLASPAQLQGKTVGITGVPSDTAVLDTEVRHAGGDPAKVHVVTVGFNGSQALVAGRIAAFTGFIPDEGVTLRKSGHPITAFALDENGGPEYPGLVAFTTRRQIAADPALVRDFVAATVTGYEDTLRDPARSLDDLLRLNPSLPRGLTEASLDVYVPLFTGKGAGGSGGVPFGTLQSANVTAMSAWMLANHLIHTPISPQRYGTNSFLPVR
ncbi:MAG TPA: ABC transporter substrate-binding protein [Solirubrobacteraceae bacterium]|jgi:NitT/TauT family transport system substrate-binding protein/putative hydroxymethylpyrimidine transport system substrate-binding protein